MVANAKHEDQNGREKIIHLNHGMRHRTGGTGIIDDVWKTHDRFVIYEGESGGVFWTYKTAPRTSLFESHSDGVDQEACTMGYRTKIAEGRILFAEKRIMFEYPKPAGDCRDILKRMAPDLHLYYGQFIAVAPEGEDLGIVGQ